MYSIIINFILFQRLLLNKLIKISKFISDYIENILWNNFLIVLFVINLDCHFSTLSYFMTSQTCLSVKNLQVFV